jgi:hypothetical protein
MVDRGHGSVGRRAVTHLPHAGGALSWSIAELTQIDPDRLTPDEAVDYLVALQRHTSWLASLEARAMVSAAGPHMHEREVTVHDRHTDRERTIVFLDEARDEIAAALHRSAATVHDQLEQARLLHGPLRRTRDALASGDLGPVQARMLVQQISRMTGRLVVTGQHANDDSDDDRQLRARFLDACEQVQDRVLDRAAASTPAQVSALASRAVAKADADGAERRRQQARADIDVHLYHEEDGLSVLLARMSSVDAARVFAAVTALAATAESADLDVPCDATAGQRRAAALVTLACGQGQQAASTTAVIDVVVDLATLMGLADHPAQLGTAGSATTHPITADELRDLLADENVGVTLRRLVTDPMTGHLLDRGRRAYTPPPALRAFLAARDRTCRFPGCRRRASRCQIDHAVPWEDGGATDRTNCGPLCVRHHQHKTLGGWEITDSAADGSCSWRSPQGRTYDIDPPPF